VGGVVADQLQANGVLVRDDGDVGVALQRTREIAQFTVYTGGQRLLGKGFGNTLSDVER
jgi:hypothetical protein